MLVDAIKLPGINDSPDKTIKETTENENETDELSVQRANPIQNVDQVCSHFDNLDIFSTQY